MTAHAIDALIVISQTIEAEMSVRVIEEGDGYRLTNFFRDWPAAEKFAEFVRKSSYYKYREIGYYTWRNEKKGVTLWIEG